MFCSNEIRVHRVVQDFLQPHYMYMYITCTCRSRHSVTFKKTRVEMRAGCKLFEESHIGRLGKLVIAASVLRANCKT